MIVSTVAGRIRVRSNHLKSEKNARSIQREAAALAGVTDARTNAAAGSLVVSYDIRAVDTEHLEDCLEALCLPPSTRAKKKRNDLSRRLSQATKMGMVTTLGTSLAYAFLGHKKAHIAFGTAFLGLASMHMLRYRSTLLR